MAHAGDLGLLAVRRRGDVTHVIPKGWSRIIKYRYDSESGTGILLAIVFGDTALMYA